MIFKAVGDSRPYPDHGYTTRQWSTVPPRLVRLDELVTTKRELDLYAAWQFSPKSRVRLSAANLLRQDFLSNSVYDDGLRFLSRASTRRTFVGWRLMWEHTL